MKKIILPAGFLALIVLFGAFVFSQFKTIRSDGGGIQTRQEKESFVSEVKKMIFGAIPGNEINSEIIRINGVDNYFYELSMNSNVTTGGTATGTVCVFRLPSATTTLVDYNAVLTTGAPTSTAQFAVYNTKGGYATSSFKAIGGISSTIAANGRLNATSTNATSTSAAGMMLYPSLGGENNSFLIFDLEGGSKFVGSGTCRIHLREY